MWGIFFGEFQGLPVDDCPAASCDSGVLTRGSLFFFLYCKITDTFQSNNFDVKNRSWGLPGVAVVKNPPANAGDTGSSPGPGRSHMPRSN